MATANAWKQIIEWHDAQVRQMSLCGGVRMVRATLRLPQTQVETATAASHRCQHAGQSVGGGWCKNNAARRVARVLQRGFTRLATQGEFEPTGCGWYRAAGLLTIRSANAQGSLKQPARA